MPDMLRTNETSHHSGTTTLMPPSEQRSSSADLTAIRRGTPGRKLAVSLGAVAVLALGACQSLMNRATLSAAFKPQDAHSVPMQGTLRLWAGDMNFHLSPPDDDKMVRRSMRQSMELLARSGLDFVYVTPKVNARFYESSEGYEQVRTAWTMAQQTLQAMGAPHPLMMLGMEYADEAVGSATIIGVDIPKTLGELSREELRANPSSFANMLSLRGGVIILNHPLATPLKVPFDSPARYATVDRSWRPMTQPGIALAKDMQAINQQFDGMETYSVPVSVWRDQYVMEDPLLHLRESSIRLAQEAKRKQRRIIPVGGSDSRGRMIRATTFIAAPEKTPESLRRALLAGRVCVRSPLPCAVRVYSDDKGGTAMGVGDAVVAERSVELRWDGEGQLYRNGELLGDFESGTTQAANRGDCQIYQLHLGGGVSGPIYVNCPFAATVRP